MKKYLYILIALLCVALISFKHSDKPFQYQMNGSWMPSVHDLHVGAQNYTILKNLRPTDTGYETVEGWTKINTTPIATPVMVHHFTKEGETHLVAKTNSSGTYKLYENTTAIPSQGDFSGTALYTVNSGLGSFANGPQGTMFYVDDDYSLIWGGDELSPGAFFTGDDTDDLRDFTKNIDNDLTTEIAILGNGGSDTNTKLLLHMDGSDGSTTFTDSAGGHSPSNNGNVQIDTAYKKWGTASALFDGTGDYVSVADHADWDVLTQTDFTIDLWVKHDDHANTETYVAQYEDGSNYWMFYHLDGSGIRFLAVTGGATTVDTGFAGEITDTGEHHVAAIKHGDDYGIYLDGSIVAHTNDSDTDTYTGALEIGARAAGTLAFDGWMDEVRIQHSNYFNASPNVGLTDTINIPTQAYFANGDYFYVASPLKLDGIKLYVQSANAETSTLSGAAWNGQGWSTLTLTDNTASGGVSLAQTGTVTWTYDEGHDVLYMGGIAMYVYRFQVSAGSAEVYKCTVSGPLQPVRDHWNGSPRVCTSFQAVRGDVYEDYTFAVESQDSTTDAPYAATIGGISSSGNLNIMFDSRAMGINFAMVTSLVNAADAQIDAVYYWDGDSYVSVGNFNDGTFDGTNASFSKSGALTWSAPNADDEHPQELFGKKGYVYKITVDGTLTDGTGHDGTSVDYVTGITAPLELNGYNSVSQYNGRVMLIDGNRIDFSQQDAPWVFNGVDGSYNGNVDQSLYFGDDNEVVATTSLFNRYGSNLIEALVVLKRNATFILAGSQPNNTLPEPFVIRQVSNTIGCAAPMTLVSGEMEVTAGIRMAVACWLDFAGPVVYEGTVPTRLKGMEKYFDPSDSTNCINYSYIDLSWSYIDTVHNQWNLIFPIGSSTTPNKWIAYDFEHKKWFEKVPDNYPYCATGVTDTDGARYNYAIVDTGYMMYLDNGSDWDGTAISQQIRTGLFSPEMIDNLGGFWTKSKIRGIRLISEAITEDQDVTIQLYYDGSLSSQTETIALNSGGVISRNSLHERNFNQAGSFFQIDFTASTSTDKWKPLAFGYRASFIRED